MKYARALPEAGGRQFSRVVTTGSANDQDDVGLACQFLGRPLAETGWQAHGVHHLDFGLGEALADERSDTVHALDRLRGLGCDAESGPFLEAVDILLA